jgi:hypothetical protein
MKNNPGWFIPDDIKFHENINNRLKHLLLNMKKWTSLINRVVHIPASYWGGYDLKNQQWKEQKCHSNE